MAPSLTRNTHADCNVAISILPPPVLLTPRLITDEELAMPMTAAPTNEGTSEVSLLASSDSGICPPSSKKARTTSLSTAMKQSQLKSTNDDNNIEVVDAEVEGATAKEEIKWSLCRPEALGRKVQSRVWCHFMVFHHGTHPDKKNSVACILCFKAKSYDCGTVCSKGGNTSGLIHHMRLQHPKHYDETMKGSLGSETNGCQDITSIFQPQEEPRYLGIGDAKELFKTAIALWMIDKGIPFSMVEEKTFRKMFEPLNKKAHEIVNVDRKSIREVVMRHGRLAE
jgi:hypothetical protein